MDSYGGGGHIGYSVIPGVTAPAADFTRVGRGRRGGGGGGLHLLSEVGPIKLLSQSEEGRCDGATATAAAATILTDEG